MRWIILCISKGKKLSIESPHWNISQDVGLGCFQVGETAKIGQCAGEHFKFYLLNHSLEIRALLAFIHKYYFPR